MATIRRVLTVCDLCEAEEDVRTVTIKVGASERAVDLCAEHRTAVEEAHRAGRKTTAGRRSSQLVGVA